MSDLLACDCGHDIAMDHNSNGCYHRDWSRNGASCPCRLTDDQDLLALVDARVAKLLDEQRENIAREIQAMGSVWGGDQLWMTTGTHVADLAADIIRETE